MNAQEGIEFKNQTSKGVKLHCTCRLSRQEGKSPVQVSKKKKLTFRPLQNEHITRGILWNQNVQKLSLCNKVNDVGRLRFGWCYMLLSVVRWRCVAQWCAGRKSAIFVLHNLRTLIGILLIMHQVGVPTICLCSSVSGNNWKLEFWRPALRAVSSVSYISGEQNVHCLFETLCVIKFQRVLCTFRPANLPNVEDYDMLLSRFWLELCRELQKYRSTSMHFRNWPSTLWFSSIVFFICTFCIFCSFIRYYFRRRPCAILRSVRTYLCEYFRRGYMWNVRSYKHVLGLCAGIKSEFEQNSISNVYLSHVHLSFHFRCSVMLIEAEVKVAFLWISIKSSGCAKFHFNLSRQLYIQHQCTDSVSPWVIFLYWLVTILYSI